jgi:hypothetical protein
MSARVELVPGAIPFRLDLLGDTDANVAITPPEVEGLRAMVREALRVFGPPPFSHYDFLVSVSDRLPSTGGIEHRASSESNVPAAFFQHPENHLPGLDLLPHELAHAWNGLYRQPAELWTPNFNVPMRDSLLWVYEGQTELWGLVLAARAGLRTVQDTLDMFAIDAAIVSTRAGRAWKTLADTSRASAPPRGLRRDRALRAAVRFFARRYHQIISSKPSKIRGPIRLPYSYPLCSPSRNASLRPPPRLARNAGRPWLTASNASLTASIARELAGVVVPVSGAGRGAARGQCSPRT